jgi:hypothetical protein
MRRPARQARAFDDGLLDPLDGQSHELAAHLVADTAHTHGEFVRRCAAQRDLHFDLGLHGDPDTLSHGPDLPAVLVGTIRQPFMLGFKPISLPAREGTLKVRMFIKDGVTNREPIVGNKGNVSEYPDDDGGFMRIFGARYYRQPYPVPGRRKAVVRAVSGGWKSAWLPGPSSTQSGLRKAGAEAVALWDDRLLARIRE